MNESFLHEECEYIILILIHRSTDISIFGTGRVKSSTFNLLWFTALAPRHGHATAAAPAPSGKEYAFEVR